MTYGKWRLWTGHWPMVTHLHGITSKYFKWKADDSGQSLIIIKIKTQWNIYSAPQSICMCVSMSIEHSGCCCVSFEWTGYIMCAAVVYMSGNANMWKWWHCFSEIGACECRCWCFVCSFCIVLSGINSLNARKLVWFTLIFVWKFNWIQHKIHSKYTENRFAWFSLNIQIQFFLHAVQLHHFPPKNGCWWWWRRWSCIFTESLNKMLWNGNEFNNLNTVTCYELHKSGNCWKSKWNI